MASMRGRTKANSGGEAKAGKRRAKKEGLRDLEAKKGQKVRGGDTSTSSSTTGAGTGKLVFNAFTITKTYP